jgi:hypothetical protein
MQADLPHDPGASPTPAPTEPPKPSNPEPLHPPADPDNSRLKEPEPGKREHPAGQ